MLIHRGNLAIALLGMPGGSEEELICLRHNLNYIKVIFH